MTVRLHGKHMELTDSLKDYALQKLHRRSVFDQLPTEPDVTITMSVEGGLHRVDVTCRVHGVVFRADEGSDDMYASIDLVSEKIEQQIHKYKDKVNSRLHGKGPERHRFEFNHRPEFDLAQIGLDEEWPEVTRTKHFSMKPRDVNEAAIQMDRLGHQFFVYRDIDTGDIQVLYRRKSHGYGLIIPS